MLEYQAHRPIDCIGADEDRQIKVIQMIDQFE